MIFYKLYKERGNLVKAYKMHKICKKIIYFDLFDEQYYLKHNPDVKNSRISPIDHYLYFGYKEGRNPGKLFNNNYYLKKYPDVKKKGMNPLVHYILHGKKEGRYKNMNEEDFNDKKIKELNKKLKKTNTKLINTIKRQDKVFDSYQSLFNVLFVYTDIETKGLLRNIQLLINEILIFIDNVCKKHEIEYWLAYGNLLGVIRHDGKAIPWDDDGDIGLMRRDYEKFFTIINQEIKDNGLEDKLFVHRFFHSPTIKYHISAFGKVAYRIYPDSDKFYDFIADVDLFPYEFISVEDGLKEEIAEKYQIKHDQYYIDITDGKIDKMEGITRFREEMGLTDSKANYVVPGVDGDVLRFYNTSDLFPLKKANYEGIDVFIPNNPKGLLKTRYGGNIMKMPQVIGVHDKLKEFSKIDNINEIYEKAIDEMREANKNFKN